MKNITIKLDDDVAHWVRVWAARHNSSVSKMLSKQLKRMMKEKSAFSQARRRFMTTAPAMISTKDNYPSRNELHER